MRVCHKIGVTLEMIKWEHSIFALAFALTAAMLAASGWPRINQLFWIIVCMVLARSAGMAFNRWADAELDARNPRTRMRAIPAGQLTKSFVGGFTIVTSMLFLISASQLNRLTLLLAPAEPGLILLYSYTKLFTRWSHLVLGLVLGSAPAAAWVAIRGTLDPRILVLTLVVLCWVGGFDTLYACQDAEHDRREGLKSLPAAIGIDNAFQPGGVLVAQQLAYIRPHISRYFMMRALRMSNPAALKVFARLSLGPFHSHALTSPASRPTVFLSNPSALPASRDADRLRYVVTFAVKAAPSSPYR